MREESPPPKKKKKKLNATRTTHVVFSFFFAKFSRQRSLLHANTSSHLLQGVGGLQARRLAILGVEGGEAVVERRDHLQPVRPVLFELSLLLRQFVGLEHHHDAALHGKELRHARPGWLRGRTVRLSLGVREGQGGT